MGLAAAMELAAVDLRLACCLKWPASGVLSAVCGGRWVVVVVVG